MSPVAPAHRPEGILFIVGFPRSGTTMLRTVLDRHPHLNILPVEPHYILDLYDSFGPRIDDVPKAIDFLASSNFVKRDEPRVPLSAHLQSVHSLCLSDFLLAYYSLLFDDFQEKVLVLKLPVMARRISLVRDLFPEAAIVNLVRDPRAAVASHKTRWPHRGFLSRVTKWLESVRAVEKWTSDSGSDVFTIRYEDLLGAPETVLRDICGVARIPFTPELLNVDYVLPQWNAEEPGKPQFRHFKGFDTGKIEQWKEVLTPAEIRLIESLCEKEMSAYAYEPLLPAVNPLQYAFFRTEQSLRHAMRTVRQSRD